MKREAKLSFTSILVLLFISMISQGCSNESVPVERAASSTGEPEQDSGSSIINTNSTSPALDWGDWRKGAQLGAQVSVDSVVSIDDTLKGFYPTASGGVYIWSSYNISVHQSYEVYVEFWAKMPGAKQGCKFLKVFSENNGGYANTTLATDYTGYDMGSIFAIAYGDGSQPSNDTTNLIKFDGTDRSLIGRSRHTANVVTPQMDRFSSTDWGTDWHYFKVYMKFNSGTSAANEVADGAYYVQIDDKVYVNATGLFNRHHSNAPIHRVELFGWAQNGSIPFELWYRDVRISTTGFSNAGPF